MKKWMKTLLIALALVAAVAVGYVALPAVFESEETITDPGIIPPSRAVRERIGIDSRVDSYLYNGADLYGYSDNHSTQKWKLDGGTGAGDFSGDLNYLLPLSEKATDYTITAADSGTWFVNTAGITYTLPTTPTAGLWYGFVVSNTNGITVTLDSADQILWETNAAGDKIAAHSSGEAFKLIAQGASKWLPVLIQGTIDDVN